MLIIALIHMQFYQSNKMKGYSKNKLKWLPILVKQVRKEEQSDEKEKRLLMQVQKLDQILKSDNLKSMHGFIFTDEIKKRLSQDLLSCINKKHRLISFGFELWSKVPANQEQFTSECLIKNQLSFKNKLQRIGFRKVEEFESKKNGLLSQFQNKDWHIKTLQKKRQLGQDRNGSTLISSKYLTQSNATTPQKRGRVYGDIRTTNKIQTEIPQSPEREQQLTLHKIQQMLNKVKEKLVGIWLPPKSYPQFYGIMVPSLIKTAKSTVKCRLKKYILFKQGLNSRLFEAILDYLSEKYHMVLQKLQLIVQKQDYHNYFQKMGCKIASWEGFDKILICYYRKVEYK